MPRPVPDDAEMQVLSKSQPMNVASLQLRATIMVAWMMLRIVKRGMGAS
jgi:hypothetical protein